MKKLRITIRDQWPDAGDHWNAHMLNPFQKVSQLICIEHRLRDRVLSSSLNLPLEPFDLFFEIDCAGIHSYPNTESRWLTDWIVAQVQTMVQLIHHVCQADGVDIKDGGRVWIGTHLWWITGDDQNVSETEGRSA